MRTSLQVVDDFEAGFVTRRFFGKPAGSEFLFVGRRDEDAAFTVFGTKAAMKPNARSAGYLQQDGQGSFEPR